MTLRILWAVYVNQTLDRHVVSLSDARTPYLASHAGHTGFRTPTSHRKSWLVGVAGKVDARSQMYRAQLSACRLR